MMMLIVLNGSRWFCSFLIYLDLTASLWLRTSYRIGRRLLGQHLVVMKPAHHQLLV